MPRKMHPARRAAIDAGSRHYIGTPCGNGHAGERYTSTGACVACQSILKRIERKRMAAPVDDFDSVI